MSDRRVGRGTPGSPDVYASEAALAQTGHAEVRRQTRRFYSELWRRRGERRG